MKPLKVVHIELKVSGQPLLNQIIQVPDDKEFAEVVVWGLDTASMTPEQRAVLMSAARVATVLTVHVGQEIVISLNRHNWVRLWA